MWTIYIPDNWKDWSIYPSGHYMRDYGIVAELWRPGNENHCPQLIAQFKIKINHA